MNNINIFASIGEKIKTLLSRNGDTSYSLKNKESYFNALRDKIIIYLENKYGYKVPFADEVKSQVLKSDEESKSTERWGAYIQEFKHAIVYTSAVPDLRTFVMACFHEYRHGVQDLILDEDIARKQKFHAEIKDSSIENEFCFWTNLANKDKLFYKVNPLEVDAFVFAATLGEETALYNIFENLSIDDVIHFYRIHDDKALFNMQYEASSNYHKVAESLPEISDIKRLLDEIETYYSGLPALI